MKYCQKCGTEMEDGDLFCGNCGAKQPEVSEGAGTNKVGEKIQNINLDFKGVFTRLVNVFIKPVSGAKDFIKNTSRNETIFTTVVLLIISTILGLWRVQQILSVVKSTISKASGYLGGLFSLFGGTGMSKYGDGEQVLHLPYGMIFLENILVFIVIVAVLFGILYLSINIVNKNKVNILTIYNTAIIFVVPFLYFKLISIIVSYVSSYAGLFVELIGIIISIITLCLVLKDIFEIDNDKAVIVTVIASIIVIIISILCLRYFAGTTVKSIFQSITDGSKLNL